MIAQDLKEIPFHKPTRLGNEAAYLNERWASDNTASAPTEAANMLRNAAGGDAAFFCGSCTGALEMAALVIGLGPKDDVIVPDYTFVTTASAFALRGANLIFSDVSEDDICLDLESVQKQITDTTKALVWVDYGGNAKRAVEVRRFCDKYGLLLIQDAAQSAGNWLFDRPDNLVVGDFVTYSFHTTKNITSGGEGGALIVRNPRYLSKAEKVFEKGTDRRAFLRGEVDKYTWRELGSSFAGSWAQATLLIPQLENLQAITHRRRSQWFKYHEMVTQSQLERHGWRVPAKSNVGNGHIFWLVAPNVEEVRRMMGYARERGISLATHYQSLSASPFGSRFAKRENEPMVSKKLSTHLVRLPLFHELTTEQQQRVCTHIEYY